MAEREHDSGRRRVLTQGLRGLSVLAASGGLGWLARAHGETVWQIDPNKCTMCGRCATSCVLTPSAVKCVQAYALCGYCDLCPGFFDAEPNALTTGAENQLCPTGAIKRTFVEDPYFEYTIDEALCVGCAKCVKGCADFGNGSFFLQIRHDRCQHCNACAIAAECPSQAFVRVPHSRPYLLKGEEGSGS